jgi:hypothetical protein
MNHRRHAAKERHWRGLIEKQRRSGLTARQFCLNEGLDESSFYHWRRELRMRDLERSLAAEQATTSNEKSLARHHDKSQAIERNSVHPSESPVFMPIRVTEDRRAYLEVVLECGTTLRVPAGFDRDTLANVLDVLERTRC